MSKKVSIGARGRSLGKRPRPRPQTSGSGPGARPSATPAAPGEPTKRLTIDLPESLHRRVKVGCAMEGTSVAAEVRTFLEKRFPG